MTAATSERGLRVCIYAMVCAAMVFTAGLCVGMSIGIVMCEQVAK